MLWCGRVAIDWATRGGVLVTNDGRLDLFDMKGNGQPLPWTVKTSSADNIGLVQFDLFDHTPVEPLRLRYFELFGSGSFLAVEDSPPEGRGALIEFVLPTL